LIIQANVDPAQLPFPFNPFAQEKWLQPHWMAWLYSKGVERKRIAEAFGVSIRTFHRRISRYGLFRQASYDVNEKFFDEPLTDKAAWVLGLIFSDGCLFGNTVEICSADWSLLKIVVNLMNIRIVKGKGTAIQPKNKGKHYRIIFTSKHIANRLRSLGLIENKSLDIQWPILPEDLYRHFVRGILDGDGGVQLRLNRKGQQVPDLVVSFYSGSKSFTEALSKWLESKEIINHIYQCKPNLYKVTIAHHKSLRNLYKLLYGNGICPKLGRKWLPFKFWMETPRARAGRPTLNIQHIDINQGWLFPELHSDWFKPHLEGFLKQQNKGGESNDKKRDHKEAN